MVIIPRDSSEHENEVISILEGIQPYLESNSLIKNVTIIRGASTPVIKLEYIEGNHYIKVDISVKDAKHKGMESLKLVQEYVKRYDSLKKILLVLKCIIKLANLNDPYLVIFAATLGWTKLLWPFVAYCSFSAG